MSQNELRFFEAVLWGVELHLLKKWLLTWVEDKSQVDKLISDMVREVMKWDI